MYRAFLTRAMRCSRNGRETLYSRLLNVRAQGAMVKVRRNDADATRLKHLDYVLRVLGECNALLEEQAADGVQPSVERARQTFHTEQARKSTGNQHEDLVRQV